MKMPTDASMVEDGEAQNLNVFLQKLSNAKTRRGTTFPHPPERRRAGAVQRRQRPPRNLPRRFRAEKSPHSARR
jgi:hypothetical protein